MSVHPLRLSCLQLMLHHLSEFKTQESFQQRAPDILNVVLDLMSDNLPAVLAEEKVRTCGDLHSAEFQYPSHCCVRMYACVPSVFIHMYMCVCVCARADAENRTISPRDCTERAPEWATDSFGTSAGPKATREAPPPTPASLCRACHHVANSRDTRCHTWRASAFSQPGNAPTSRWTRAHLRCCLWAGECGRASGCMVLSIG